MHTLKNTLSGLILGLLVSCHFVHAQTTVAVDPNVSGIGAYGTVAISGGTITGITDLAVADGGTGASTARGAAANLSVPYVLCQSAVAVTAPADTARNSLYTCTIPAGAIGANGSLRISVAWTHTSSVGTKNIRVVANGVVACADVSPTTTSGTVWSVFISNRNSVSSQICGGLSGGTSAQATVTSTINTANAFNVVLDCLKSNGADTCTMERVLVEVLYGAFLSFDRFAPAALRNAVAAAVSAERAIRFTGEA